MLIKNLDFMSGVAAILGATALVLVANRLPGMTQELLGIAGTLAVFGGGALVRWLRRPTDGDPEATVKVTDVLTKLGLPKLVGDSAAELARRAQEGWVAVAEIEPDDGEAVLGVVDGQVVVGVWGSAELEGATHWRGQPSLPQLRPGDESPR